MMPKEAMKRLIEGNRRFSEGLMSIDSIASPMLRKTLAVNGQKPFAIILTCSDSRVPAEMVFDVGLGDLFVVRVAGNVVAPSLIASIEFAASSFGTPICVVMGHSQCGAVKATVDAVKMGQRPPSDNLQNLILEISPAARDALVKHTHDKNEERILADATTTNVYNSMQNLMDRSKIISNLVKEGSFSIVGATYDLVSGKVVFEGGITESGLENHFSDLEGVKSGFKFYESSLS